jgi:ankyrin repeat protein
MCGKLKFGRTVDKLIAAGADSNERDTNNFAALHGEAAYGCFGIAKRLLADGADPNVQHRDGEVPLHLAGRFGHLGIICIL